MILERRLSPMRNNVERGHRYWKIRLISLRSLRSLRLCGKNSYKSYFSNLFGLEFLQKVLDLLDAVLQRLVPVIAGFHARGRGLTGWLPDDMRKMVPGFLTQHGLIDLNCRVAL